MPSSWYDLMTPPVNSLGWFAGINSPLKYPERETCPCFSKHSTNTTAQRLLNIVDCRTTYSLLPPHPPLTFWSSSLPFLLLLPAPLLPWLVAPSRILAYASSDDPEYNVCVCQWERGREGKGRNNILPHSSSTCWLEQTITIHICSRVMLTFTSTHTPGCPCSLRVCMPQNQPSSSSLFPFALLSPWRLVSCCPVFP